MTRRRPVWVGNVSDSFDSDKRAQGADSNASRAWDASGCVASSRLHLASTTSTTLQTLAFLRCTGLVSCCGFRSETSSNL